MAHVFNETTIRARIKTVLSAVTGIGQVHDYVRWFDNWNDLVSIMKSGSQLNGWDISLLNFKLSVIGFQGGGVTNTILVNYFYRVRGFFAIDDSAVTEKSFVNLCLQITDDFNKDITLRGSTRDRESPVVSGGDLQSVMYAGVLCHGVEILLNPQEVI